MRSQSIFRTARAGFAVAALFAIVQYAGAVDTKVLRDDNFSDFNQGESTGTEVLAQGRLRIAPEAKRVDKSDEGVAWRVAVDPYDGAAFYCTGHSGKVYHYANGKTQLWASLPEVEAISIAIDPTGGVLVGASPGGKIYRIASANKPELYFDTKEQYIWDMIFDRRGVLYAATGANGKIYRIRGANNGEVLYDSDATNVMALTFDREGRLIAATQGKAYVLRIESPGKAYVMYASQEDEARTMAVDLNGNIYVAINSARMSSVFERSGDAAARAALASATPTPSAAPGVVVEVRAAAPPSTTPQPFMMGLGGQSAVYQIQPSGFVAPFWQAPEGPIQGMLVDSSGNGILVAAGNKGKIYRLQNDMNYSVVADVEEAAVLAFAQYKEQVYFTTANKASLYQLITAKHEGLFASRAFNAGSTVRWGNLYYEAEEGTGSEVSFETRTGNTPEPEDKNWSNWTAATRTSPRIFQTSSPVAQYLQYRLTMSGPDEQTPTIDNIQLFYVQQNAAPVIKDIRVDKVGGEAASPELAILIGGGARPASPTPASASGLPSPPGLTSSSGSDVSSMLGSRTAMLTRMPTPASDLPGQTASSRPSGSAIGAPENSQKYNVSWAAADPNGDRLQYRLYFKGEDELEWKLVEKDLTTPRFSFSTEAIPDGKYRMRVEATDAPANPDTSASTVTLVSRIFLVDNTPPEIHELKGAKLPDGEFDITADASDATSILSSAEYNIDAAKEWRSVFPEDGIFDYYSETFRFRAQPEKDTPEHQEHTISLRVYDREGNSHVQKVLLR